MFLNDYPYTDFHELNADFLLRDYKKLLDTLKSVDTWIDNHEKEYNELKHMVDDLENGNWSKDFVNTLLSWYHNNIVDIIGEMVKQVFFGITDSGYFVAYIPESWSDITFGTTGLDDFPLNVDYGHLTLSY